MAIDEGKSELIEVAEDNVVRAIRAQDMTTTRWFLERKGRDRGYGSKLGHEDVTPVDPELETKRREVLGAFMAFLSEKARGLHRGICRACSTSPRRYLARS